MPEQAQSSHSASGKRMWMIAVGLVAVGLTLWFWQHRANNAEALQRDLANVTAIRAQANRDAQERRLQPAIQGFERLVQLRPNDADAWQRLGLLLIGARENYRGLDALSHAAALAPSNLLTQRVLGNVAVQAGRLDQANHAFHAVLDREPNNPEALTGVAKVMMRLDPSPAGLEAAQKQVDLALSIVAAPEAYSTRGQIRMTRRRWSEAIQDFTAAIALAPRNREYYVFLSQCYAGAGHPDLASKASSDFDRLTAEKLAEDRMPTQTSPAEQKAIR